MQVCRYTSIDLFAGAGGLTEGFKARGFQSLFANDHEKPALETFRYNHGTAFVSSESIEKLSPAEIRTSLKLKRGDLDVLLGGPPCQGFSTYGKRDSQDKRNRLYLYFLKFLEEFRPKTFVIENVVGILSMDGGEVIEDITARAYKLGYAVTVFILDAVEFGVPQYRKRVFICGGIDNKAIVQPAPTHACVIESRTGNGKSLSQFSLYSNRPTNNLHSAITVHEAIGDLPREVLTPKRTTESIPYPKTDVLTDYQKAMRKESSVITHHSSKQMLGIRRLRLALMRPGDYGTYIRSRLLNEGLPANLIEELLSGRGSLRDLNECRTEDRLKEQELRRILQRGHVDIDNILLSLDSGGYANKYRRLKWDAPSHTLVAHMARDCSDFVHPEVDRFISVREAARLQSFPDTYFFPGSQFQQFRQIGNAVPPKLAEAVALTVVEFLEGIDQAVALIRKSVNESDCALKLPI